MAITLDTNHKGYIHPIYKERIILKKSDKANIVKIKLKTQNRVFMNWDVCINGSMIHFLQVKSIAELKNKVNSYYVADNYILLHYQSLFKNTMTFLTYKNVYAVDPTKDYKVKTLKRRNAPKSLCYGTRKTKVKIAWGSDTDKKACQSALHIFENHSYKFKNGSVYALYDTFFYKDADGYSIAIAKIKYDQTNDTNILVSNLDLHNAFNMALYEKVVRLLKKSTIKVLIEEHYDN